MPLSSKIKTGALVAGASLVGGILYATKIEPARVEICSRSILLPRLGRDFDGYRVALISDLHMDGWMNLERMKAAME